MFKIGDIITGKSDNSYMWTTNEALMIVVNVDGCTMDVKILCHASRQSILNKQYDVDNSEERFQLCTYTEFASKYSGFCQLPTTEIQAYIQEYQARNALEPYILSYEMRQELIDEMKALLIEYHYHPTDAALNKIIDEWCLNKADLIRSFKKHPNYNGKFQITFDHDFDRVFDKEAVLQFTNWLSSNEVRSLFYREVKLRSWSYNELVNICYRLNNIINVFYNDANIRTINGKPLEYYAEQYQKFTRYKNEYDWDSNVIIIGRQAYDRERYSQLNKVENIQYFLRNFGLPQFIDGYTKDFFNDYFPEAKVRVGQKLSKVINKILCLLGVNKAPDYNKEFAKLADGLNPLKIKRHTIISVHPIDYLTMSFGNSWASCHTIDKRNDRDIDSEHNYRGCNSSGTMSYMLDGTSCVFYTVDASHDGKNLELADKINRCMFHYYDHRLVQGRVYPQSNDSGANDFYRDIREIAQKVFADMLGVPNYWTNNKGTDACDIVTLSKGTHYKDYLHYETCNVSTLKDADKDELLPIRIGHDPICPCCGKTHSRETNIECWSCNGED